mmetsp:Transcript_49910/g.159697  ORF Transcript_49910/g.159697 Transcript_49910/m.159697 type:complete len:233 (-) Transcript_49910:265-963(-)
MARLHHRGVVVDHLHAPAQPAPIVEGHGEGVGVPGDRVPHVDAVDDGPHALHGVLEVLGLLLQHVLARALELPRQEASRLGLGHDVRPHALEHRVVGHGGVVEGAPVRLERPLSERALIQDEQRVALLGVGLDRPRDGPLDPQPRALGLEGDLLHEELDGLLVEVPVCPPLPPEGDAVRVRGHGRHRVELPGVLIRLGLGNDGVGAALGQWRHEDEARGVEDPRARGGDHWQ